MFTVKVLSPDRVRQVYPVIAETYADITLDRWLEFATTLCGKPNDENTPSPEGLLAIQDERGYVYGVCRYRRVSCLRHGHALLIDMVSTVEPGGRDTVKRFFVDCLGSFGRSLDCDSVLMICEISSAEGSEVLERFRGLLAETGHRLACFGFHKHSAP